MSNYVKATNFAVKDTLTTGDPAKIVKGTEIDTEFNAIASAVTSKADSNSPTLTGTPVAPTASAGTSTTQLATTAFVVAERTNTATLTNKTLTSPTINGGTISGITDLAIVDGGTGASTAANARTNLDVPSRSGANASGTWGISITGNAATATSTTSATTATKLTTASGSAPSYAARAWVNFNGTGTVAIRASGNVSSITDNGVGDYTLNFTTAMPDANYAVVSSNPAYATATAAGGVYVGPKFPSLLPDSQASLATGSVRIATTAGGRANANAFQVDPDSVCVSILR